MFKRKTKPAHVRLQTHTHRGAHWLSRTHPAREKREAEGKNTKEWKRTHSLLSDDTRLEENPDKTRQSGENWSVWWFDIHSEQTQKQLSRQKLYTDSLLFVCLFKKKSTNTLRDLYFKSFGISLWGLTDTFTYWTSSWGSAVISKSIRVMRSLKNLFRHSSNNC